MFFCIAVIALLAGCGKTANETMETGTPKAKINGTVLFANELKTLVPEGLSGSDSIAFLKTFINKWAYNEIFYQQAVNYLSEEEMDVNKQVEDFKKELIRYKFEIKLINDKLDTNISVTELENYYNANNGNFLLKNNIVKVLYIKTPVSIPNFDKFKKLCYSTLPKDAILLKTLCVQYANNYYMTDNTWLMFDDLKKEMNQLNDVPEYTLQKGKIFEFTDVSSFYFLKILDVKSKNTLSPFNFEKNNIKNMLINQRKQQLISGIKKDFFEKAKTNKEVEIYN